MEEEEDDDAFIEDEGSQKGSSLEWWESVLHPESVDPLELLSWSFPSSRTMSPPSV